VLGAGPPGRVDVGPHLEGSLGADDRQAHVAPGAQPGGGQQVDAVIADHRATVGTRHQAKRADVGESGVLGVGEVAL